MASVRFTDVQARPTAEASHFTTLRGATLGHDLSLGPIG
jgi:hypothetical protein